MTKTKTKPDTTVPTKDARKRHIIERTSPIGITPPLYSRTALCGEVMREMVIEHNGEICQECVDIQKKKPRE